MRRFAGQAPPRIILTVCAERGGEAAGTGVQEGSPRDGVSGAAPEKLPRPQTSSTSTGRAAPGGILPRAAASGRPTVAPTAVVPSPAAGRSTAEVQPTGGLEVDLTAGADETGQ